MSRLVGKFGELGECHVETDNIDIVTFLNDFYCVGVVVMGLPSFCVNFVCFSAYLSLKNEKTAILSSKVRKCCKIFDF